MRAPPYVNAPVFIYMHTILERRDLGRDSDQEVGLVPWLQWSSRIFADHTASWAGRYFVINTKCFMFHECQGPDKLLFGTTISTALGTMNLKLNPFLSLCRYGDNFIVRTYYSDIQQCLTTCSWFDCCLESGTTSFVEEGTYCRLLTLTFPLSFPSLYY